MVQVKSCTCWTWCSESRLWQARREVSMWRNIKHFYIFHHVCLSNGCYRETLHGKFFGYVNQLVFGYLYLRTTHFFRPWRGQADATTTQSPRAAPHSDLGCKCLHSARWCQKSTSGGRWSLTMSKISKFWEGKNSTSEEKTNRKIPTPFTTGLGLTSTKKPCSPWSVRSHGAPHVSPYTKKGIPWDSWNDHCLRTLEGPHTVSKGDWHSWQNPRAPTMKPVLHDSVGMYDIGVAPWNKYSLQVELLRQQKVVVPLLDKILHW